MPNYDAVLFDCDGTFADTCAGVLASANAAFVELGFPQMEPAAFRPYLGPSLQSSFVHLLGMTLEQAQHAIEIYRREYAGGNCYRLRVFDGMEELLQRLRDANIKTAIASAKPLIFLEKILERLGMRHYFDAVCGVGLNRMESAKADIIAEAAARCCVPAGRCLMVGDRNFDIEGAKALGMPSAGVLFGFGSPEELTQAGADFLAEDCAALERIIFD
jgi:phosphoglycolate phosphatase